MFFSWIHSRTFVVHSGSYFMNKKHELLFFSTLINTKVDNLSDEVCIPNFGLIKFSKARSRHKGLGSKKKQVTILT